MVDVPTAHTPPGGYGDEMPAAILASCSDPLPEGAPDLRGTWRVVDLMIGGARAPAAHRMWRYVERIEQCGNRLIVTGGGVVHDMVVDGTFEHGVNDVLALLHVDQRCCVVRGRRARPATAGPRRGRGASSSGG